MPFAAAVLFSSHLVVAQPYRMTSVGTPSDTVSLGFERVWNTFMWNGVVGAAYADSQYALIVHQALHSKLIRTSPLASQGQYDGYIQYRRKLEGNWDLLARTASLVVSDNQSIDLSRLAQHQALLGLEYGSGPWWVGGLGGYEVDAQQSAQDEGPVIDALVENPGLHLQQIDAAFQAEWTKSFLGRRNPEQQNATMSLARDFGGGSSDSLAVEYSSQRREFYTAADASLESLYSIDHNIFRRDATSYGVSNQLFYSLAQHTAIVVRGTLDNRTIDRSFLYKNFLLPSSITLDSKIQELLLNGSVALSSEVFDWLKGRLGMSLEERDERFAVQDQEGIPQNIFQSQEASAKRLENTSQRTSLWGSVTSDFSKSDHLTLDGSTSILHYDTPDSMNTDDRDELLVVLSMEETHDFNQYLSVGIEAGATMSHLVYIDRLQSGNNNWNRVFSVSPRVSLRPTEWLRSDNSAEVVANYTVYDFEAQVASVKSFSFRQASWSDSTTVTLNRRIDLSFSGTLRLYERGILKWQEFKEKPLDYFVEQSLWPQVFYRTSRGITLSVGYRYFSRDQYSYDGTARSLTHSIVTAGPTVGVLWYGSGGTNVSLNGWRETSTFDFASPTYVSNLSVAVSLVF